MRAVFGLIIASLSGSACVSLSNARDWCSPPASLNSVADTVTPADALAGEYRLILVADSGSRGRRRTEGVLHLRTQPDTTFRRVPNTRNPYVASPLLGWMEIAAARVGVTLDESFLSQDPSEPGLLVHEYRYPRNVLPDSLARRVLTVRFGSVSNRRYRARLDGPYFGGYITEIKPTGVRGVWSWSIGHSPDITNGYFCAERHTAVDAP